MPNDVPSTVTEVKATTAVPLPGFKHPLDPLTPEELSAVSLAVRKYTAANTPIKAVRFITTVLVPPPKKAVLAYLGIPLSTGEKPEPAPEIIRKAESDFVDLITGDSYNALVALKNGVYEVESIEKLPEGIQPQISVEELLMCEDIIRADVRVVKLAKDVGIEPHQLFADGWAVGYDARFPKKQRIQQAILFSRFSQHDNLYAHPMDFIPVVDSVTQKVIHIDFASQYVPSSSAQAGELDFSALGKDVSVTAASTEPPSLNEDPLTASGRPRVPPPKTPIDFLPDLIAEQNPKFKLREDLKPLHVIQPEGVSFKMDGHVLEWQKWKMHIAFHHREGIALSTITYDDDGVIRPIVYRLSLAEMVVPYAAPEHPHPRKHAFDSGEYGMGTMANELSLGCDCLGEIHYLPGCFTKHDGSAFVIKNAICIHEEDHGLLWKHVDFRPGGRAHAVRARRLVVSQICTLANYEYIFYYYFYQDGTIELEIRLTGILQLYVKGSDEPNVFGTTVAPGINAQYHQHLFSLRVDPMVDGLKNTVVETDILPLDAPTGSIHNFAGNGFITRTTPITAQKEGGRDYDIIKDRRWVITNPKHQHPYSGANTGFVLGVKSGITRHLQKDDSWVVKRAGFIKKSLWVVKDEENDKGSARMWPSGKYVPGTRGEPSNDMITKWVEGEGNIAEEDLVIFATVGTTHIPRPEDFPVMPSEHLRVTLKPFHFFTANPSLDVPPANDSHSVSAFSGASGGSGCCKPAEPSPSSDRSFVQSLLHFASDSWNHLTQNYWFGG